MNYAALLGVVAAVAFTLPLLARLAEVLGLHRNLGVAVSLIIAAVAAAAWYVKSVRSRSVALRRAARAKGRMSEAMGEPAEERDAGL